MSDPPGHVLLSGGDWEGEKQYELDPNNKLNIKKLFGADASIADVSCDADGNVVLTPASSYTIAMNPGIKPVEIIIADSTIVVSPSSPRGSCKSPSLQGSLLSTPGRANKTGPLLSFQSTFIGMLETFSTGRNSNLAQRGALFEEKYRSKDMVELRRVQMLYNTLRPGPEGWTCMCQSASTEPRAPSDCRILLLKNFLVHRGRSVVLQQWQSRSAEDFSEWRGAQLTTAGSTTTSTGLLNSPGHSRGGPMSPQVSQDISSHGSVAEEDRLSNLDLEDGAGEEDDSFASTGQDVDEQELQSLQRKGEMGLIGHARLAQRQRDLAIRAQIQGWTLRLLWRLNEICEREVLMRCSGPLLNKHFSASVAGVEFTEKTRKHAVFVIRVDASYKQWFLRKRMSEIRDFYDRLRAVLKSKQMSVELLPIPAKQYRSANQEIISKRKHQLDLFFRDLTTPEKQAQLATCEAAAYVDKFLGVHNTQHRVVSPALFSQCVKSTIAQHSKRSMSPEVPLVLFELLISLKRDMADEGAETYVDIIGPIEAVVGSDSSGHSQSQPVSHHSSVSGPSGGGVPFVVTGGSALVTRSGNMTISGVPGTPQKYNPNSDNPFSFPVTYRISNPTMVPLLAGVLGKVPIQAATQALEQLITMLIKGDDDNYISFIHPNFASVFRGDPHSLSPQQVATAQSHWRDWMGAFLSHLFELAPLTGSAERKCFQLSLNLIVVLLHSLITFSQHPAASPLSVSSLLCLTFNILVEKGASSTNLPYSVFAGGSAIPTGNNPQGAFIGGTGTFGTNSIIIVENGSGHGHNNVSSSMLSQSPPPSPLPLVHSASQPAVLSPHLPSNGFSPLSSPTNRTEAMAMQFSNSDPPPLPQDYQTSLSVCRQICDSLVAKTAGSAARFRHRYNGPQWKNIFQVLSVFQRLVLYGMNPKTGDVGTPESHGGERVFVLPASSLVAVVDLIEELRVEDLQESASFGLNAHDLKHFDACKKTGGLYLQFFREVMYEFEDPDRSAEEVSTGNMLCFSFPPKPVMAPSHAVGTRPSAQSLVPTVTPAANSTEQASGEGSAVNNSPSNQNRELTDIAAASSVSAMVDAGAIAAHDRLSMIAAATASATASLLAADPNTNPAVATTTTSTVTSTAATTTATTTATSTNPFGNPDDDDDKPMVKKLMIQRVASEFTREHGAGPVTRKRTLLLSAKLLVMEEKGGELERRRYHGHAHSILINQAKDGRRESALLPLANSKDRDKDDDDAVEDEEEEEGVVIDENDSQAMDELEEEEAKLALELARLEVEAVEDEEDVLEDKINRFRRAGGKLIVYLLALDELTSGDKKAAGIDTCVHILYDKDRQVSKVVKKSYAPVFNQKFEFLIRRVDRKLTFKMYEMQLLTKKNIGEISLSIKTICDYALMELDVWIPLSVPAKKTLRTRKDGQSQQGRVHLSLRVEPFPGHSTAGSQQPSARLRALRPKMAVSADLDASRHSGEPNSPPAYFGFNSAGHNARRGSAQVGEDGPAAGPGSGQRSSSPPPVTSGSSRPAQDPASDNSAAGSSLDVAAAHAAIVAKVKAERKGKEPEKKDDVARRLTLLEERLSTMRQLTITTGKGEGKLNGESPSRSPADSLEKDKTEEEQNKADEDKAEEKNDQVDKRLDNEKVDEEYEMDG